MKNMKPQLITLGVLGLIIVVVYVRAFQPLPSPAPSNDVSDAQHAADVGESSLAEAGAVANFNLEDRSEQRAAQHRDHCGKRPTASRSTVACQNPPTRTHRQT